MDKEKPGIRSLKRLDLGGDEAYDSSANCNFRVVTYI
jgi:hypothetical protein